VTLLLNTGGMRIESRAEALQEGDLGRRVKVRVAGASSPVEALVVDRGRVEAMP
jgi:flagella basal body P-ring formation protein FlgA